MTKRSKVKKEAFGAQLSGMPQDFAERHIAAYMYALTGECNCPACVALRPIAKMFYEKYGFPKKSEQKEVVKGGEESAKNSQSE
jgi:hypothetical protein